MRKNEGDQVIAAFRDTFHVPLVSVDAEDRFLARLEGVTDPEGKRKIIGEEFIRVFEEQARELGDPRFLVQGTLYSDVIESGGGHGAATIKSHHNVGGLPEDLKFELVEPLRALFKDEVRQVGGSSSCATPISSCRTRSGPPACTASCGSRSASCRRVCARSGCRATSGA